MKKLIEVKNLKKYFPLRTGIGEKDKRRVAAVDDVSFSIAAGETLGLVGESGCGKTTSARCILRLIEASGGEVLFGGKDILKLKSAELRTLRQKLQIIFQDPFSSLNPRRVILDIVGEGLKIHRLVKNRKDMAEKVSSLVEKVGLSHDIIYRYPHEFSGGQRQRIAIARALSVSPQFIICDEPVSSLDVSIQAQIINLLMGFQDEMNISYLFIAHDLAVVKHISHQIAVMYMGQIVEMAPSGELFENPLHPYTRILLSSIPVPDPSYRQERIIFQDDVTLSGLLNGCVYSRHCPDAQRECMEGSIRDVYLNENHMVKCLLCKTREEAQTGANT